MTDAPEPLPNPTNAIIGDVSGQVIQAGVYQVHESDHSSAIHPRVLADELVGLSPAAGVRKLPLVDVQASADVVTILLSLAEDTAVGLLTHMRRDTAQRIVDAIEPAPDWLADLPRACAEILALELSARSVLGDRIGAIERAAKSRNGVNGFCQAFRNGHIYWTSQGGARSTTGEIERYHQSRGGTGGALGFPLGPREPAPRSPAGTEGSCQEFQFGAVVYESAAHGAYATWGGIRRQHDEADGAEGWLGFPVGEIFAVTSATGQQGSNQRFEGGAIYSAELGLFAVSAAMNKICGNGFPMGSVASTESPYGTVADRQNFESAGEYPVATIYTSKFGTHTVSGRVRRRYQELDAEHGWLGLPVSAVNVVSSAKQAQRFEGGAIFWLAAHEPTAVSRPVADLFGLPEIDRDLVREIGFPVWVGGDDTVHCERGVVIVRDGVAQPWRGWPGQRSRMLPAEIDGAPLGRPCHGSLAVGSPRDGYRDLFLVTPDLRLLHRRNTVEWPFGPKEHSSWSRWRPMDVPEPIQAVACSSSRPGSLDLFAVTEDGGLLHRRYPDGPGRWSGWRALATPGRVMDVAAGGQHDLFAVERNGGIERRSVDEDRSPWVSWKTTSGIAAVALSGSGEQSQLFALDFDGRIFNRPTEARQPWTERTPPAGKCTAIAAIAWSHHRHELFVVCDGTVANRTYAGLGRPTWGSSWSRMPTGPSIAAVTCSSVTSDHIELFAITAEGALMHQARWPNTEWTDWAPFD